MTKREQIEPHLFNPRAAEERADCGENASVHDLMSVDSYVVRRRDGPDVGTVCERCKALTVLVAISLIRDREADGLRDEGEGTAGLRTRSCGRPVWHPAPG